MDCEKFDQHVVDALYGELDELTQAGLDRHVEDCSRCGPVYAGLKATRAGTVLPIEEPPADLEARILAAADLQMRAPWRRRLARATAWAMKPQIAAAAIFCLVVGSSLFVFQASSRSPAMAPAPAAVAADTAAAREAPAPAATAEAQPMPAAAPPDPDPVSKIAAEQPADAGKVGGDAPLAEASATATRAKPADAQAVADERSRAVRSPPAAAKPPARSMGGTNPRAPAAPKLIDAFH